MQQDIRNIGIIGAGIMGTGIAQIALLSGHDVYLFDQNTQALEQAQQKLQDTFEKLLQKGKLTLKQVQYACDHLHTASELKQLNVCDLVIEAIIENLAIKQNLMQQLEEIVSPQTILASNTSSLSITEIAAKCQYPQRVAGYHFFNPVPLMKVVEVIQGLHTDHHITDTLVELTHRMGHRPVQTKDTPGFIINHAGRAYTTEALKILSENVAPIAEIDYILKATLGFRMGAFELMDLTGIDVSHPVMLSIYQQYYQEPRYRPNVLTQQMLVGQKLGQKTGEGFYRYADGKPQVPQRPALHTDDIEHNSLPAVWLHCDHAKDQSQLLDYLNLKNIRIDSNSSPQPDSLIVMACYGEDASQSSVRLGVSAQQVVAIDMICGLGKHRTLMPTLCTSENLIQAACYIFQDDDCTISLITESVGFVAQRVLAMVVNLGCDMAQQAIATVDDINAAVRLGLAYPSGPIEWGDIVGADKILLTLERMVQLTHDPRYRPSPWLQRRCRLNLSLTYTPNPQH